MACRAAYRNQGYVCPVRGCDKRHNRRFTIMGLMMHMEDKHWGELEKRLKLKSKPREKGNHVRD